MTEMNAYVFPGQGSQTVGMLAQLAQNHGLITEVFDEASERLGYNLWSLVQNGPLQQLNQTEYTQAAMLTADVAVFKLLQSLGAAKPQWMAGHSLGEYAAVVCADALTLSDAAWLVSQRGRIMQECVPEGHGAMAAIVGLTDDDVMTVCESASNSTHQVTPANFNAIGQTVIAGHAEAVKQAVVLAEQMNARLACVIPVSVPCHCPLLLEAATIFESYLEQTSWAVPTVSVISNVDLSVYESTSAIRTLLKKQLYSPVRWVETIQKLKANSVNKIVEVGPGKVLGGLIKRIDKSIDTMSVNDEASLNQFLQTFSQQ